MLQAELLGKTYDVAFTSVGDLSMHMEQIDSPLELQVGQKIAASRLP